MSRITPPLKTHGGKHDLADWIISKMPPRCKNPNKPDPADPGWLAYCEPYFGGGAVLLAQEPEGISEVVNDIDGALTNFWDVLKDEKDFRDFFRRMKRTPFSQVEFERAVSNMAQARGLLKRNFRFGGTASVQYACDYFVVSRQSMSGRGDTFSPTTRNRTRAGMNEQVSAWLGGIRGLQEVHHRLRTVLILNKSALEVIRSEDGPRTLFYLDPPYLHETRATTGEYQHEMTEDDHSQLLIALREVKGRFLLSGYHSRLYDSAAGHMGWTCHEKRINNHAASGKKKRTMTEALWTNF